jgi:hypothetical protein
MHIPSHPVISYLCSIAPHLSTLAEAMDYGDRRSGADYLGRLRSGLRASTLVHVSSPIGRPMQCHIGFLMMWKRESKEREKSRCLAKQPPHERNNYLMRQLHNHCMSCCCHATHNIPFYEHKLRNYIDLATTTHTMVVQLSHEIVVSLMRWLFRKATTSFSLLTLFPPHQKNPTWHCMGRPMGLLTCGKLFQKVMHAGAKLVKLWLAYSLAFFTQTQNFHEIGVDVLFPTFHVGKEAIPEERKTSCIPNTRWCKQNIGISFLRSSYEKLHSKRSTLYRQRVVRVIKSPQAFFIGA